MTFLLIRDNFVGVKRIFGSIEAESAEKAAADPRVGFNIKERRGELYLLETPSNGTMYQDDWLLQEVKPLTERPKELK